MGRIDDYVTSFPKRRTRETYKSHLKNYFKFLDVDSEKYFSPDRDYIADLLRYWDSQQKYAPCTRVSRRSCILGFLEDNDVNIPSKIVKRMRRSQGGSKPVTLDTIPKNSELKQILQHGGVMGRALFLFASSSGMRINEVLSLEFSDIDLERQPARIYIRAETTKTNQPRICFITDEAKNVLMEWIKIREKWLENAVKRHKKATKKFVAKNNNDKTIFCFAYTTAHKIWKKMLKDSGFDEKDRSSGYFRMHIHTLRKFFKTRMLNAGVQEAYINKIMGHESLDSSYLRFTEHELEDAYLQGAESLTVFESQADLSEINERLLEKDEEIASLNAQIQDIHSTLSSLGESSAVDLDKLKNLSKQDIEKILKKYDSL